jgi:hypothetical protein
VTLPILVTVAMLVTAAILVTVAILLTLAILVTLVTHMCLKWTVFGNMRDTVHSRKLYRKCNIVSSPLATPKKEGEHYANSCTQALAKQVKGSCILKLLLQLLL